MSTRSRIGKEQENGTVRSIYSHSDGYPHGVGKILLSNYQDPQKLEELINLGDISYLQPELDQVIAYHRDLNEEYSYPKLHSSIDAFFHSNTCDYGYVMTKEGGWLYKSGSKRVVDPVPLVEEI